MRTCEPRLVGRLASVSDQIARRVLIVQRRLPKYRTILFETLRAKLMQDHVTIELLLSDSTDQGGLLKDRDTLPWSQTAECMQLRVGRREVLWQKGITFSGHDLVVLQHEAKLASNVAILLARRSRSRPTALWGIPLNRWADLGGGALRAMSLTLSDWYFAYTPLEAERLIAQGYPAERVTALYNTIDTATISGSVAALRKAVPQRPQTCIFLGSLRRATDLPFLLAACELIAQDVPGFRLIVGGEGEFRPMLEAWARVSPWLDYRGRLDGAAKAKALAEASLALHPGHIGLSLVELLAVGCVPILREVSYRGPEVDYAIPDVNCVSLPPNATERAYADTVVRMISDAGRRRVLREQGIVDARMLSVDNMADHYARGIIGALNVGSRSISRKALPQMRCNWSS
jgi:glycosyltransferase involved in cell wall biosynthesis